MGLWFTLAGAEICASETRYVTTYSFPGLGGALLATLGSVLFAALVVALDRKRGVDPSTEPRAPAQTYLYLGLLDLLLLSVDFARWLPFLAGVVRRLRWLPPLLGVALAVHALLERRRVSSPGEQDHPDPSTESRFRKAGLLPLADRLAAWGIPLVVLVLSVQATLWILPRLQPTGDEPQYLRLMESIVRDGDVELSNNTPGYVPEWPPDWCRLHHLLRTPEEKIRSIHSYGLPLLAALPYAAGGRLGVLLLLGVIGALSAGITYRLGRALGTPAWATMLAVGAGFLSVPLRHFTIQIYPELPAALLTVLGLWLLLCGRLTARRQLLAGLCAALLPFLHIKYLLLTFSLCAVRLLREPRNPRALWPSAVAPALGLLGLALSYERLFGSPNPFTAYREYAQSTGIFGLSAISGSLIQLLDGRHGLLVFFPLAALAPWGAARLLRRRRTAALAMLLYGGPYFLMVASHSSFRWLGWSPPGRFLLPIMPLILICTAEALGTIRGAVSRVSCLLAAGWGVAIAGVMIRTPAFLHDRDALWRALSDPELTLSTLLPRVFPTAAAGTELRMLFVGAVALILGAALPFRARRGAEQGPATEPLADSRGVRWRRGLLSPGAAALLLLLAAGRIAPPGAVPGTREQPAELRMLMRMSPAGGARLRRLLPLAQEEARAAPRESPLAAFWQSRSAGRPLYPEDSTAEELLAYAQRRRKQHRLLEAVSALERARALAPESDRIRRELIDTYLERRMWEQALSEIDALLAEGHAGDRELLRRKERAHRALAVAYAALCSIEPLAPKDRREFQEQLDRHRRAAEQTARRLETMREAGP
jgi:hypothetical protein